MGWGAGQGNGGTQATCLSACLSTVCVWVCLCVSGGPVGGAGGHEAGGQGSSDPLASPFMGRGALEGFDDVASDGEAEDTGRRNTRLEVLRPRCSTPSPIPG